MCSVLNSQRRIKEKDVTQIKPEDSWASYSLQSIGRITPAGIREANENIQINTDITTVTELSHATHPLLNSQG